MYAWVPNGSKTYKGNTYHFSLKDNEESKIAFKNRYIKGFKSISSKNEPSNDAGMKDAMKALDDFGDIALNAGAVTYGTSQMIYDNANLRKFSYKLGKNIGFKSGKIYHAIKSTSKITSKIAKGAGSGALTAAFGPLGAVGGGALLGATNNIIEQTGKGVTLSQVDPNKVAFNAFVGGVAGAASSAASHYAGSLGNSIVNGLKVSSPVLSGAINGAVTSSVGAVIGAYIGASAANGGEYNPTKWQWTGKGAGKTYAGLIIGGGIGALVGWGAGAILAPSGLGFAASMGNAFVGGEAAAYTLIGLAGGGVTGYGAGFTGGMLASNGNAKYAHSMGLRGAKVGAILGSTIGSIIGTMEGIRDAFFPQPKPAPIRHQMNQQNFHTGGGPLYASNNPKDGIFLQDPKTNYSDKNVWGKMYIVSNADPYAPGITDGHAWIRLESKSGSYKTTMSLFANRGTQEFWTNIELSQNYGYIFKVTTITINQYNLISIYNSNPSNINWTPFNSCAGYSASLWNYVTGDNVSASDNFGFTTPRSLSLYLKNNP